MHSLHSMHSIFLSWLIFHLSENVPKRHAALFSKKIGKVRRFPAVVYWMAPSWLTWKIGAIEDITKWNLVLSDRFLGYVARKVGYQASELRLCLQNFIPQLALTYLRWIFCHNSGDKSGYWDISPVFSYGSIRTCQLGSEWQAKDQREVRGGIWIGPGEWLLTGPVVLANLQVIYSHWRKVHWGKVFVLWSYHQS